MPSNLQDLNKKLSNTILPPLGDTRLPLEFLVGRVAGIVAVTIVVLLTIGMVAAYAVPIKLTVVANAAIAPSRVWPVRAQETGLIARVAAGTGDTVQANQEIARLDTLDATALEGLLHTKAATLRLEYNEFVQTLPFEIEQKSFAVRQAEATLTNARATLRERLADRAGGTNVDSVMKAYVPGTHVLLDAATSGVTIADAELAVARSRLKQQLLGRTAASNRSLQLRGVDEELRILTERRRRLVVRSPVRGTVLSEDLERLVGSIVHPGDVILEVADRDGWRATMQVSDVDVHRLARGDQVVLDVPALHEVHDGRLAGHIVSIGVTPEGGETPAKGYRVVALLDPSDVGSIGSQQLRRGYSAKATIITQSATAATLVRDYVRTLLR